MRPSLIKSMPWIFLLLVSAASAIAGFPSRSATSKADDGTLESDKSARFTASAQPWIASGLASFSQDPRPLASIEIVADYEYFSGDGQKEIHDITRIDLPSILWQERHLEGGKVQRGLRPESAFVESPRGRMELEPDQRRELSDYLCLRRLAFLSFCDGLEVDVESATTEIVWLRIERQEKLFARLALDARTAIPSVLEWQSKDPFSETATIAIHFAGYQEVDGWLLPHHVESFSQGEPFYRYRVASANLKR